MQTLAKEVGCDLQKETYRKPICVLSEEGELSLEDKIALLQSILPQLASTATQEWFDTTTWLYKPLSQILPDTLSPVERQFIAAYLEADAGLSPDALQAATIVGLKDDLSDFLELFKYKKSWFPAKLLDLKEYQYRVVGGMMRLIEAIRKRLDADKIRPEHVLTRIHKDTDNRFHLFFNRNNGAVHEVVANAVIMTIPFSVLRSLDLDESLELTDLHKQAIQTLSYGTNSKIQVMGEILPEFRYSINTETHTTAWTPVAGPGLTLFMGGETGATLSQATAAPLMRAVLASSSGREAGPADAPAWEEFPFIVKNWREDPFARGSYSTSGLHSPTLDVSSRLKAFDGFRQFAEPVGGFIFAGEHTQMNEGYMESAVRSGDLAARYYLANKSLFGHP